MGKVKEMSSVEQTALEKVIQESLQDKGILLIATTESAHTVKIIREKIQKELSPTDEIFQLINTTKTLEVKSVGREDAFQDARNILYNNQEDCLYINLGPFLYMSADFESSLLQFIKDATYEINNPKNPLDNLIIEFDFNLSLEISQRMDRNIPIILVEPVHGFIDRDNLIPTTDLSTVKYLYKNKVQNIVKVSLKDKLINLLKLSAILPLFFILGILQLPFFVLQFLDVPNRETIKQIKTLSLKDLLAGLTMLLLLPLYSLIQIILFTIMAPIWIFHPKTYHPVPLVKIPFR